jgi:dTDP-4-dehydrorhamnose reductase
MARFSTILLTGANGQVGYELQHALAVLGNVIALERSQLDLSDADAIRRVVREIKPDLIVNPAAYTAVDKAEAEPELAMVINAVAPGVLAEEAVRLDAPLVHYSTDYVYDGAKSSPYVETDSTNPLSVYGKSKLAGENAIRAVGLPHLMLRTSWVYGARGKNFLRTILRLAAEREQLRVVSDQIGAPTWSRSIAEATLVALNNWNEGLSGTYHLTCAGQTSWYGFAREIVKEYEMRCASRGWPKLRTTVAAIKAIKTTEYPTPAPRPANSRLDCTKIKHDFPVAVPDWREALRQVLDDPGFNPGQN